MLRATVAFAFSLLGGSRFALGLVLLAVGAAGANVDPRETSYFARTWTTDHGLPHNIVSRAVQDSTGFIWLATVGGLARFDGRAFREWPLPEEHWSRGFNIRGLAEETPGHLVVLTAGGSVLRLSQQKWSVHPAMPALAKVGSVAVDLYLDRNQDLWFITGDNRLFWWSATGAARVLGPFDGLAARARRGVLASDSAGNLWIAATALWAVDKNGHVRQHALSGGRPRLVAPARDGGIWVWLDRALVRLRGGTVVDELDLPARRDFGAVRQLYEDTEEALWISTSRSGLFCYAKGRLTEAAPYVSLWSVAEDREGNIWVATDGHGVGQLREKSYRVYNKAAGLPLDGVSAITEDASGVMWLANRGGGLVAVAPDGKITQAPLRGARAYANVVCADAGGLWYGGGRNGLLRWTPNAGRGPSRMAVPGTDLHVLFRARNGDVWFAAGAGAVGYHRGDVVKTLTTADGFARQSIAAIAEDSKGGIWLGGRGGELLHWDGAAVQGFGPEDGFPGHLVHTIWIDAADRLWIGTTQGLVLKDGKQFHLLTEADGLGDDIIQQILEGDGGRLWFATRRGIFYADKAALLDVAHGKRRRVASHRLGPNQGLIGLSPTANYQPAAAKARDGRLWFGTAQGAVVIEPRRLPRDLPLPPVIIDEVRVDGEVRPLEAATRIPSRRQRLEFRFAALAHTVPEEVVVRHQLEGVDTQWIDSGTDRSASYTNLPPGSYRLRVTARNSAGLWNMAGATWEFEIVPAWWETFGFRFITAVVAAGLIAWVVRAVGQRRMRLRLQRLEQQHALEKERIRIARDLHDDLGSGLTEVGLLADRLVDAVPPTLAPQLSGLAWRTRRLATDLSGIVWTMNPSNSTLDQLAVFLGRYAQRLFRTTATRCIVTGTERIPVIPLSPELQHQLVAAAKEALNNILKHAGATEAHVEMRYADGVFTVRITDDGVGFAAKGQVKHDGNGLRNMRARMAEIGGAFAVASTPGHGTEIVLRVPCGPVPVTPER